MPWTNKHLKWLVGPKNRISTSEGYSIEVWELQHNGDAAVFSAWAKHFRNHYCLDTEIDDFIRGPGLSKKEFLNQIKFPDQSAKPGPSIRAGDFGEILAADFLQYHLSFWVPRSRYSNKTIRNESTKGCDVVGFKMVSRGAISPKDVLAIFESKAQFTGSTAGPRLQDAVDGSSKDQLRKAESLNAIWQRLYDKNQLDEAGIVERFQNYADRPYQELFGAVALFSTSLIDEKLLKQTTTQNHPSKQNLKLFVFHGPAMMDLVHKLYEKAADEA